MVWLSFGAKTPRSEPGKYRVLAQTAILADTNTAGDIPLV